VLSSCQQLHPHLYVTIPGSSTFQETLRSGSMSLATRTYCIQVLPSQGDDNIDVKPISQWSDLSVVMEV